MIQTTFQSRPLWILDIPHDGRGPFRCDFEVMAHVETGLSNREERRALASHLRARIGFSLIAQDSDARRLEAALHACGKDRVAVPLWPTAVLWQDRAAAKIKGGLQILIRAGWSQWEVFEEIEPGWATDGDTVVPLVVGRLEGRTVRWIHPDACEFEVNHVEASPAKWSLRVTAVDWRSGPLPAGYSVAPWLFPLGAQFDQPSGTVTVSVSREEIGFGREPVEELHQEIGAMQRESASIETGAQIATALRWAVDHAAGRSFWMPRPTSALRISEAMFDGQTAAIATDTFGVRAGDWVAFLDDRMAIRTFVQIESVAGQIVRFATSPGTVPAGTFIPRLELVRFTRPRISVEWLDAEIASVTIPVRAVPAEASVPADEEIGFTLGAAWHRVWLYEFSRTVAGVVEVERLTSHEEDIELDGVIYTAARVDHGAIVLGIALDRDEVEIRGSLEDLDMIRDLAALRSEAPVRVRILEASITRLRQFSADFEPDAFQ
jgi:hypothetical protein